MINLLSVTQGQLKDVERPSSGSAGAARPAGAAPPSASPEVGPANPRMRLDRDLGMVVIEFRDSVGRLSVSLPTTRELEAYRAAVLFGADIPSDVKSANFTPGGPSASRPGIPMPEDAQFLPVTRAESEASSTSGLNKNA
jgi:hypothetical protein